MRQIDRLQHALDGAFAITRTMVVMVLSVILLLAEEGPQHRSSKHHLIIFWGFLGAPGRYPEWWPRVVEVRGERFEEGDEYVQVTRDPIRNGETNFLLERREDLREIRMSCQLTGMFAHWLLTPAQGGTFVEGCFTIEPNSIGMKVLGAVTGRRFMHSWLESSLENLRSAAAPQPAAPGRVSSSSVGRS
jgi:hypothetical protein